MSDWEDRFWASVAENEVTGCWLWTRSTIKGYGQFGDARTGCRSRRSTLAHRVAYELVVGQVPEGLVLDHLCSNRLCCNPAHLEPVTQRENVLRSYARLGPKAACKYGHAFSAENTRLRVRRKRYGTTHERVCRQCERERDTGRVR